MWYFLTDHLVHFSSIFGKIKFLLISFQKEDHNKLHSVITSNTKKKQVINHLWQLNVPVTYILIFRSKLFLRILAFVHLTMSSQKTGAEWHLSDYHWIQVMKIHPCHLHLDRYNSKVLISWLLTDHSLWRCLLKGLRDHMVPFFSPVKMVYNSGKDNHKGTTWQNQNACGFFNITGCRFR